MKYLLSICILTSSLCARAQLIRSAKDLNLADSDFKYVYGSVAEYNMEQGLKFDNPHHHMVMLIGARVIWLKEFTDYMVAELSCSRHVTADGVFPYDNFHIHPSGASATKVDISDLDITTDVDDSLRIKKVYIKGNPRLVKELFIKYWSGPNIIADNKQTRKGMVSYKNAGSDRVCFNWKGPRPVITIVKNPAFPTPIPVIAERKG